jgi:hypothetical protein
MVNPKRLRAHSEDFKLSFSTITKLSLGKISHRKKKFRAMLIWSLFMEYWNVTNVSSWTSKAHERVLNESGAPHPKQAYHVLRMYLTVKTWLPKSTLFQMVEHRENLPIQPPSVISLKKKFNMQYVYQENSRAIDQECRLKREPCHRTRTIWVWSPYKRHQD